MEVGLPRESRHQKDLSYLHRRLSRFLEGRLGGCLHQGPAVPEACFRFFEKIVDGLGWKRQLLAKAALLEPRKKRKAYRGRHLGSAEKRKVFPHSVRSEKRKCSVY